MIRTAKTRIRPRLEALENRSMLSLAALDISDETTQQIRFKFRWSPTSSWTSYTEAPGDTLALTTPYEKTLTPQVVYGSSTPSESTAVYTFPQGYSKVSGADRSPKRYEYLRTDSGNSLFYWGRYPEPARVTNLNSLVSDNWSGYVAATNLAHPQADTVTAVRGSWIVPKVTGPTKGSTYSLVWVGIDGFNGGTTVEQIGTEQDVRNGHTFYRAWWEMWSEVDSQSQRYIAGMKIKPGDQITASVVYVTSGAHKGQFQLTMRDWSNSNGFFRIYRTSKATQKPLADRSTAEWIVESPGEYGKLSTLADFGKVRFSNASAIISGIKGRIEANGRQTTAQTLVRRGVIYDATSILTKNGGGFEVSYNPSARNAGRKPAS